MRWFQNQWWYPRKNRPYVLITDAALGDGKKTFGGLGAILTQINEDDPFIKALKAYLLHKELQKDPQCEPLVKHFSTESS